VAGIVHGDQRGKIALPEEALGAELDARTPGPVASPLAA
jgi:hypothetical protein